MTEHNDAREFIAGKNLMDEIEEGDMITWGDRSQPLTVMRHVTEDDTVGQLVTMNEIDDPLLVEAYDIPHDVGDLIHGDLTGDEFFIVRGPRGGAYLLTQWWSKKGGQWSANVALYRVNREGKRERWGWEDCIDVYRVGHEDVNRDSFADGVDALITDQSGRNIWFTDEEGAMDDVEWHESDYNEEDDSHRAAEVCRHLYDDTDHDYTATSDLILVDVDGEADAPPTEATRILQSHGWQHDPSQDMPYCPWENGTIFGFRPA